MIKKLFNILSNQKTINVGIFLSGSVIAKAIPFFILPIVTGILGPDEYGTWSLFMSIFSFLLPLVTISFSYQVSRKFFNTKSDDLGKMIYNLLVLNFFMALFLLGLIFVALQFNYEPIQHFGKLLYLIPVTAFFICIKEYATTLFIFEKRPKIFSIYEISTSLLSNCIALALLVYFDFKWEALLIGHLVTSVVASSIAFLYLLKKNYIIRGPLKKKYTSEALKVCVPLIPHAIAGTIISVSDRLIISDMLSLSDVGIYSVGYTVGMLINFVINAFNYSWAPWVYKKLEIKTLESKKLIIRITYLFFIGLVILWLILSALGYIYINYFIDEKYQQAIPILLWVSLGYLFRGFYISVFPYMTHLGRTWIYPFATITSAIVNIGLTIYLVGLYGMIGAAQATAASFLVLFVIIFIYSQIHYPMPWLNYRKPKI